MASMSFVAVSLVVLVSVASVSYLAGRDSASTTTVLDATHNIEPALNRTPVSHQGGGEGAHIYFVLDRSGSMSSIRGDVIGGFNSFVEEQRRSDTAHLRMTLVQFDSDAPHEVVFQGQDIKEVAPLTAATFQPRSLTPLFDALGDTIDMAEKAQAPNERVVVVTFSDGQENASKRHSRKSVFDRIAGKQELGWTFVFLGANQDSYAEGGKMGFGKANTQNFAFDSAGTFSAFSEMSRGVSLMRHKMESRAAYDSDDFFEGTKLAEDDYASRKR